MDDLNDLTWSSTPASAPPPLVGRPSYLSASSASTGSSRTGSPADFSSFDRLSNQLNSNRSYSPSVAPPPPSRPAAAPARPKASAPAGGSISSDAFSSLLSFGSSSASAASGTLSLADKQRALAEAEKKRKEEEAKRFQSNGAFWDQLGGGSSSATSASSSAGLQGSNDFLRPSSGGGGGTTGSSDPPPRISSPALVPSRPTPSNGASSAPTAKAGPVASSAASDPWSEFDVFASSKPAATLASQMKKLSPSLHATEASSSGHFDFDSLDAFTSSSAPAPKAAATPRSFTPQSHEFGDREDLDDDWGMGEDAAGLLGGGDGEGGDGVAAVNDDDDDFMSAFNRPPPPKQTVSQPKPSVSSSSRSSPPLPNTKRSTSPPPHIIGQLVEMGFGPFEARAALASTETGVDVQQALEMLMSAANAGPAPMGADDDSAHEDNGLERRMHAAALEEERAAEAAAAERRRRRRQGPSRSAVGGPSTPRVEDEDGSAAGPGELAANVQDSAARLLAQANLLGGNMFNRANALWSQGKTQVQKAMEERQRAAGGGEQQPDDGRPKWMRDAERYEREAASGALAKEPPASSGGFRDGSDDEEDAPPPSRPPMSSSSSSRSRPPTDRQQATPSQPSAPIPAPLLSAKAKIASLFGGDDEPTSYVSPNRRRPTPSQGLQPATATASSSRPRTPLQRASTSAAAPAPPPIRKRELPPVSPTALASVASDREAGNALFKLGRFGEAEQLYTRAVDALPPTHLRVVPLLNNRATTRLKNGDSAGCVEDCARILVLIAGADSAEALASYEPASDPAEALPADARDLAPLAGALGKALARRAAAWEAAERWTNARDDWDAVGRLAGKGSVAVTGIAPPARTAALDGLRRCRKMVDLMSGGGGEKAASLAPGALASSSGQSSSPRPPPGASKPKPKKPKPAAPIVQSGEALAALRSTTSAQEADDNLRAELKDTVDARLLAWKGGKEANLRALLASLENVLWPSLRWEKVGLHELVTDKQVKIRYTRAIGKVHPDKLAGASVEERMIANGVFGALNEAWNASQ